MTQPRPGTGNTQEPNPYTKGYADGFAQAQKNMKEYIEGVVKKEVEKQLTIAVDLKMKELGNKLLGNQQIPLDDSGSLGGGFRDWS